MHSTTDKCHCQYYLPLWLQCRLPFELAGSAKFLHFTSLGVYRPPQPPMSPLRTVYTGILNYSKTTRNILFIDVSASRRKPSSGLTSGVGRQYVKACPIGDSVGSSPRVDSCSPSSWSILPPLYVCQLCLILDQSPWRSPSLSHDSRCKHDL